MKSRFSEEQNIVILKQQESGRRVAEICREQNISPKCEKRGVAAAVKTPCGRRSMDFIHDRLSDGRSFRTLNLTDALTRQCLAQEVDISLTAKCVVSVLESAQQQHGTPQVIRVDNGSEFTRSSGARRWVCGRMKTT